MRKTTLAIALLCMATLTASAKSVVLTLANGTKAYYLLGSGTDPVMRFTDGKVSVNTDDYAITGIKNFYISATDDPNSIESTLAERNITLDGNTIVVPTSEVAFVRVFTIDGKLVPAAVTSLDGITSVSLEPLQPGTYVVRIGDTSVKIQKK